MIIKRFENFNKIGRIVLTGVSGSGKTSVINKLKSMGFDIVEEPARTLISYLQKNDPKNLPWNNRNEFQKLVEKQTIDDFENNSNSFFDRGIVDEIAFREGNGIEIPEYLDKYCNKYRYDKAFIFPPYKEIYKNDAERVESFEDSERLHKFFIKAYKDYGYSPILVPKDSIENRAKFILKNLYI